MIHPFPHFQQNYLSSSSTSIFFFCILFYTLQTAVTISYLLSLSSLNLAFIRLSFLFYNFSIINCYVYNIKSP